MVTCSQTNDRQALEAPLRHYVIVRRDLPPGIALAQAVHAAGETGPAHKGTYAVVLSVPDEGQLLRTAVALLRNDVDFHLVREDQEAMAIGVAPCNPTKGMRRVLSSLPLWK